jgi:hypothetical protein
MRLTPIALGLGLALAVSVAWGDELELRPPKTELEIELGPRDRPARPRVFWLCYAGDLGTAARTWLHARSDRADCAIAGELLDPESPRLAEALVEAAGGRVLGDPRKGETRELDAMPGAQKQLTAHYCYTAADVQIVTDWTRRQLAALCAEPPASQE